MKDVSSSRRERRHNAMSKKETTRIKKINSAATERRPPDIRGVAALASTRIPEQVLPGIGHESPLDVKASLQAK